MDLCEALNAGYLLRLSIVPDTRMLDPHIFRDFYPEAAAQGEHLRLSLMYSYQTREHSTPLPGTKFVMMLQRTSCAASSLDRTKEQSTLLLCLSQDPS